MCQSTDAEITIHTFLTSAIAGSKEEVTLVNNKHNHFNTLRHTRD